MKIIINTPNSPAPIGPYSQAVMVNDTLYVSGQIAIIPATGELLLTDVRTETKQVMENIGNILREVGMDFQNVVKASIFLSDMDSFGEVNGIYGAYFTGSYPARETVQVSCLPKSVNVEISVIAVR